ncbi:hypothetical protein [Kineococcus radiotolerans]|uniref:Uncharacterized protein n=1 Tax=Kineococcus radiotolerans (strain ATCC BAA-149 / DSM 14245 / SRS30216) TaxID=266940 RepID=A6W8Q4_KINRD|nr:hypothetical protein [Kineococcus radiotolerans]ABS03193.1 hypothetical protein Krad_1707 [Kineococcus radiotolerans SRS30216 = ATCC BAA-149]
MGLQAEWDPVGKTVIAFLDDTDAFRPRQATGAAPTPGVATVVLNVQSVWPDPYLPLLPDLLGPAVVRWDADTNTLVREWPQARYTPDAVRAGLTALVNTLARTTLAVTDWVVVRQLETEEPVPEAIAAHRSAVRAWTKERKATLQAASPAGLLAFDLTPPAPPADSPRDDE